MIADPLAVFLVLALIVYAAVHLERRSRVVRSLGSVLTAIVITAVLSNVGILPARSETYDVLGGVGVNLGIALILMGVDVKTLIRAGPAMLGAFALGAIGTAVGAIAGGLLLSGAIGPETWKLAGQYTGTYIGGGVNFVAVGAGLETSAEIFGAAVAADHVTTALWMAASLIAPVVLAQVWGRNARAAKAPGDAAPVSDPVDTEFTTTGRSVTLLDTAAVLLIATAALFVAEMIGRHVPSVPTVLWLTTFALIVAQIGPVRRLAGGPVWGNYLLHLFLAGLGAQSIIREIVRVGPAVFYYTLIVVGIHGLLLFGVGRMLRLDLATLTVASQANVGGPASAMAIATARGYQDRVVPGVAVGLLGYAVGNYTGFAVAGLMRTLVG